ncbi:MAG: hypothetical protein COB49_08070 [Alphaproteobacteria bacterium]|nr:MAG: hypothetical protein COB49_08070 [Alphaproteobacteria bacterium]
MSKFMHKLVEALRSREQYLEDHSTHPVFESAEGSDFKQDYENLVSELKEFSGRIKSLAETGEDYDEHFERKINDENEHLSIKIDTWSKSLEKK